jgi:hypothetical protein
VRYSFHGKVRATGQQVDGFVEAATASQAIDRLADRGIIGVYSVRPEAKAPKNAIILSGEAEPEEEQPAERPRSERSRRAPIPAVAAPIPQPAPVQHQLPAPQPAAPSPATDAVLTQLVDKVSLLLVQVEKLLSRPQQVVYQSGPARSQGSTKKSRMPNEMQSNTLRDIFQTNLDLRQSLEKLANTVGPSAPRSNGELSPIRDASKPGRESVPNGRDLIQAQPAA